MPTLNWIGKDKVLAHHQEVPYHILESAYTYNAATSGNRIIHGDNLTALKSLLPQYEGRIKCIYIDPPYNTGNEGWVYNDRVNDPKILKWLHSVVGKEGEDLSRHDKWLCMMYPRLRLLHKLLAPDGAIFISIDDNEQASLKMMMDEIFGGGNFVNNIIWQKKFSPSNDARYFSDNHDFVICYAKAKSSWERNLLVRTDEQNARYKNIDNDHRGVWTSGDVSVKTYSAATDYPIETPSGRIVNPPAGYSWRFSKEKFQELVDDNRIWFGANGDNVPRFKRFLADVQQGTVPLTIWTHEEVGHNQSAKQELKKVFADSATPFETPKPTTLIERILQIASDKDSIILDSFAGSGTTAHAVLNLNRRDGGHRKFILIEMEDYAGPITAERVKRVIDGYGTQAGTGGSFTYATVGAPLFHPNNTLNEAVPTARIREYIWHSETATPLEAKSRKTKYESPDTAEREASNGEASPTPQAVQREASNQYFLGSKDDSAYYFYYEPDALTTLDDAFLSTIRHRAATYIIYADTCILSKPFMQAKGIIFKKIPRDITRF